MKKIFLFSFFGLCLLINLGYVWGGLYKLGFVYVNPSEAVSRFTLFIPSGIFGIPIFGIVLLFALFWNIDFPFFHSHGGQAIYPEWVSFLINLVLFLVSTRLFKKLCRK